MPSEKKKVSSETKEASASTKYKWDREKWEKDPTWWDPFNKSGRLKGKGGTSRARQERGALRTPEERQARKAKRDEDALRLEKEASAKKAGEAKNVEAREKWAEEPKKVEAPEKGAEAPKKVEAPEKRAAEAKPVEALEKGAAEAKPAFAKEESHKPLKKKAKESSKPLEKKAPEATYKEALMCWQNKEQAAEKQWVKKPHQATGPPSEERNEQNKEEKEKKRRTHLGFVSLGASSSSTSEAGENSKPLKKVAVDWHNVIQVWSHKQGDHVPDAHIRAIWHLQAEDIKVVLISFAGPAKGDEVEEWARSLPVRFDEIIICSKKTCWKGKADIALELGCECIIDDDADICWESLKKGLKAMPIQTWKQKHTRLRPTGHSLMQSGIWFPCKGLVPHKHLLQKESPANAIIRSMHILWEKRKPWCKKTKIQTAFVKKALSNNHWASIWRPLKKRHLFRQLHVKAWLDMTYLC